jgi:hypothetical protein
VKKVEIQDYGQTKVFFGTLSFSLWAILAMWLHIGVPQKYKKNEFAIHFLQNSLWIHMKLEFDIIGIYRSLRNIWLTCL